jgi:predicted Zn-dependent protease
MQITAYKIKGVFMQDIIDFLEKKADNKTRFILNETRSTSYNIKNKKTDTVIEKENIKLDICKIIDSKNMFSELNEITKENIEKELIKIDSLAKYKEKDFYAEFPEIIKSNKSFKIDQKLIDFYNKQNKEEILKNMLNLDQKLKDRDKTIKYINSSFSTKINKKIFIAENFLFKTTTPENSLSISTTCEDKTTSNNWSAFDINKIEKLDFNIFLESTLDKAKKAKNIKEKTINLNDYILCFNPSEFIDILETFIIDKIDIESYERKNNFITKNFNKKIFDSKLNISENPFMDYSEGSTLYDNDFVNTSEKKLIKNGTPIKYITDHYYGFKYKSKSTGNSLSNAISNLVVQNGTKSFTDLLTENKNVLYIESILGLHTTNSTEGSLNVNISSAAIYENGIWKEAVKNIPLNISFTNLLKNIELSKEKETKFNYSCPYVFCKI